MATTDYGTITFVEGPTPGQGTYTVSERNIIVDLGAIPAEYCELKGSYFILQQNLILICAMVNNGPNQEASLWMNVTDGGNTVSLSSLGTAVLSLTKQ